jgi:hypothetical protein
MKMALATMVLGAAMVGVGFVGGCDKTLSHDKKTVETPEGTVKTHENTVKEKSDGTIVKEHETHTDNNP